MIVSLSLLNIVAKMVNIPLATAERTTSTATKDKRQPLSRDNSSSGTGGQPDDWNVQQTLDSIDSTLAPVINDTTNATSFKDLSTIFSAAHSFQLLLKALDDKTFHHDHVLVKEIAFVGNGPLKTTDDLKALEHDIHTYSILSNILASESAFQPPKQIIFQALHALQHGTSLDHFSGTACMISMHLSRTSLHHSAPMKLSFLLLLSSNWRSIFPRQVPPLFKLTRL